MEIVTDDVTEFRKGRRASNPAHVGGGFRNQDPRARGAGASRKDLESRGSRSRQPRDRFTHCGEDAIQLAKTDLGWPGWKIIAMADTQRTEGCNPP